MVDEPDLSLLARISHTLNGIAVSLSPRLHFTHAHLNCSLEGISTPFVESPSPPAKNRGGRRTLDETKWYAVQGQPSAERNDRVLKQMVRDVG